MRVILFFILGFLRQPIDKLRHNKISVKARISFPSSLVKAQVGSYTYIGPFCALKNVSIGRYCSIAPSVSIGGMEHPYQFASTSPRIFPKDMLREKVTVIEDDVWIGANAFVRQGVRIGRGAVIGASSLVLKDVEPYSIVVGSPARKLKMRFADSRIAEIEESKYWMHSPKKARALLKDYPHVSSPPQNT